MAQYKQVEHFTFKTLTELCLEKARIFQLVLQNKVAN